MTLDVVSIAQGSSTAAAFEAAVLECLRRQVDFDAAFFLAPGLEDRATAVGMDERAKSCLLAADSDYERELLPVKRAALGARGVAVDTQVCGIEHVHRTKYYRDFVAPVGGEHSLMAYVPWRGRIVAAIMLGRSGRTFRQNDIELLESLLPSLGVARAAFGLRWVPPSLPFQRTPGGRQWLGLGKSERVLARVQTKNATLTVRDRAGFREMVATDGPFELVWTRACLQDPRRSGWPYVELLHLAPVLARHRRRVLFVGSGGAVSLCQFASVYSGIRIDVVEHELAVIDLARKWFELDAIPGVTVHIADGASFIRSATPHTWDIIIIDAYSASECGSAFLEGDFLQVIYRALAPGGAVACNLISTLRQRDLASAWVSTARSVFEDVRLVPVVTPDESALVDSHRNVVVIAKRD